MLALWSNVLLRWPSPTLVSAGDERLYDSAGFFHVELVAGTMNVALMTRIGDVHEQQGWYWKAPVKHEVKSFQFAGSFIRHGNATDVKHHRGKMSPNAFGHAPGSLTGVCFHFIRIMIPAYVPATTLTLLVVFAFARPPIRTWYRRAKGRCLACGYSLTGNESGSCPECGVSAIPADSLSTLSGSEGSE